MTRIAGTSAAPRAGSRGKLVLWALLAVGLVLAAHYFDAPARLRVALDGIARLGPWGPVFFALLYVAATVFFLPGSILTVGAGVVFGLARGFAIVSISATLGATAAFLVGRYLARAFIAGKIEGHPKFKAIDEAVAGEGWKIVALLRLSPVVPFNVLNYAFGVTRVSLRDYVLASWIGMMPGTVLYVYLGSIAGDLAGAGGRASRTPAEWAFYAVGLVATIAVTVFVTRLARRALAERVPLT
jgi:uncharacterized membrane protein YdjX (TVP38/TMEM64 family)